MCYASGVPRFRPFRGLRYAASLAPLVDLIAPPYDVVNAEERRQLAARSPYNSILVELPVADAALGRDRYEVAAALFASWQAEGVLVRDPLPALYVYRMRFVDQAGEMRATTGVIGALGLEPSGGAVVPHEQTMAAPGRDRLDLLRACRVNSSPIWGFSLAAGLTATCTAAIERARVHVAASDDESTEHEMWLVEDDESIRLIAGLVAPEAVVIADGHHRHETAERYRTECLAHHDGATDGCDSIMAFLAELSPDELTLRAIHRLVSGLPDGFDLLGAFRARFRVEPAPREAAVLTGEMATRGAPALATLAGTWLLLPPRGPTQPDELDSRLVDEVLAALAPHETCYEHSAERALEAVRDGRAQAALLVRPAPVGQLEKVVGAGMKMPAKSTYFHPKPQTGFVFRPLA